MTDEKMKRRWGLADADTSYDRTFAALVIEPAVDFIVRTGEIIVLAGAFSAAAQVTKNPTLAAFSGLMFLALGLHFGIGFGRYIYRPLQGWTVKSGWKALLLGAGLGGAIGIGWLFLWLEIVAAARALVTHS